MAQNVSLARSLPTAETEIETRAGSPRGAADGSPGAALGKAKDYTVEAEGGIYAGMHILVDLWGASRLDDVEHVEKALREAVDACGATLLHIHLHEFTPNGGVSGVAVLAESHISVHTWPEHGFGAFDVFMCGSCNPRQAVPVLERFFRPERLESNEQMRGRIG